MAAAQSSVRMAMGIARRSHGFRLSSPAIPNQNQAFTSTGPWRIVPRAYSAVPTEAVEPPEFLSEGERKIFERIKEGLKPTKLEVQDISGGCGSMYALDIVSEQFKGLPIIKQHRLVNNVLGDEMKKWHGVQMKTKAP